jgi:hypothetical protein
MNRLSRPSGEWGEDDFDVLADGVVVGRIMKAAADGDASPPGWRNDRRVGHGHPLAGATPPDWQPLYATASSPRRTVWRTSKPSNCGWSR